MKFFQVLSLIFLWKCPPKDRVNYIISEVQVQNECVGSLFKSHWEFQDIEYKPANQAQSALNTRPAQVPLPWNWPGWEKYEDKFKVKNKLEICWKNEII
jgi:hypothetical protein